MGEEKREAKTKLQWHPAFYAGLQIEFEKEAEELIFESEHQLGTKPKEVDVLITKKHDNYQVKKNIGRFFRKYNLVEYKPPGDSLTIDDFYKVCGYACFYKADSAFVNSIKVDEITVTFATFHYPREMIKCLKEEGRYQIKKAGEGIYYIEGGIFPIQLIVTRTISEEENFWLRNLTDKLKSTKKVQEKYQQHSENTLYKSVMDIIVKANKELFNRRENEMCQALFDIYKEDLMEMAMEKAMEKAREEAMEEAMEKAREEVMETTMSSLVNILKTMLPDAEAIYHKIKADDNYKDVTREQVEEIIQGLSEKAYN